MELFRQAIDQNPVNLPLAALSFAQGIAYPDLEIAYYLRWIEALGNAADRAIGNSDRAAALSHYLFQEKGFKGNLKNYSDPRNSFLNDVIEQKVGIPISLSLLYVTVAQQIGINAYGLALPGHFIVGVTQQGYAQMFDPFNGGAEISLKQCRDLIQRTTGYTGAMQKEWLQPASNGLFLTRMLNNLRRIYMEAEAWVGASAVIEHMRILAPNDPQHVRDYGLIQYRRGNLPIAYFYIEKYLAENPDAQDAEVIKHGLAKEFDAWVKLN